jgi:hypothetical protein
MGSMGLDGLDEARKSNDASCMPRSGNTRLVS